MTPILPPLRTPLGFDPIEDGGLNYKASLLSGQAYRTGKDR